MAAIVAHDASGANKRVVRARLGGGKACVGGWHG
jgi:hypothetical protein